MPPLLLPACLSLGSGAQEAPPPRKAPPVKPGGQSPVDPDSPLVKEARDFVQKHLALLHIETVREAHTQVVAGRNVRLLCAVGGEEAGVWEFAALKRPDGHWRLLSARRVGD